MKKRFPLLIASMFASATLLSSSLYAAEGPGGTPPSGGPGGGADTMTYDYSGSLSGVITSDTEGGEYATDTADQNVILASDGQTLTVSGVTLNKSGDDNDGDSCNFYGVNSIALAVGEGSTLYLSDAALNADSTGSNAIFSTDNATVYAKDITIATTSDNSRGLDATYGGTIIADGLAISTQGDHCAALATDRGGGQISVTNSTLETTGSGSPLIYSIGDIEVDNVTGTTSGSQIAGMEGLNTILIYNSDLTSTNTTTTGSDPVANGIILYQSTSGDAEATTGDTATFQAVDSTLTSAIESGSFFYITNTSVDVLLSGTTLNFDSEAANLLQIEGNSANNWGSAGSNGANVTFTAIDETLSGDISVDTISSLDLYLTEGTTYTGAMNIVTNANGSTSDAPIIVNLDGTSTWVVTEDSTISQLNVEEGASIVDSEGKTVTILSGGETVVEGESSLTVTVTGSYSQTLGTAGTVSDTFIDRSEFDSYYGTTTSYSTNGASEEEPAQEETSEETEPAAEESSEESTEEESSVEVIESSVEESSEESVESSEEESAVEEAQPESSSQASYLSWILGGAAALVLILLLVLKLKKK